jgi:hypothetical protein
MDRLAWGRYGRTPSLLDLTKEPLCPSPDPADREEMMDDGHDTARERLFP